MLLKKLKSNNKIPFHMPGHKRNTVLLGNELPFDIDITEIDGFDNLHNPKGILKEVNQKLTNLYHSKQSFMLVNGSTSGILSAVSALVKEGDNVLISRNCHKSVYNGIELVKGKIQYLTPAVDEYGIFEKIDSFEVEKILSTQNIKLLIITSPTYEGVISDINKISSIAHKYNTLVLVDGAHGAHFFDFYENCLADIVVVSLHKTLPALTQCAAINVYSDKVDLMLLKNKLSVFQTSSPSYVLMSSIDKCVDFINDNSNVFTEYKNKLNLFYSKCNCLSVLKLLKYDDSGKIVVFCGFSNISGTELSSILRNDFNIEIEMASTDYVVAMTSICDTDYNLSALANALLSIDKSLSYKSFNKTSRVVIPEKYCEPYEIGDNKELLNISQSVNKVCCEYVFAYPPGIPILVPGEIISKDIIDLVDYYLSNDVCLYSDFDNMPDKILTKKV
ncbi:MAG: aminotransferase class I/II-fold pyridoxal phosphate-dependent enzyme [Ruminococcus sp.]